MVRILCLWLLLFAIKTNSVDATGCSISIKIHLTDPQPLLINKNNSNQAIDAVILPNSNSIITFKANENFMIACPGGSIKINNATIESPLELISCVTATTFKLNGKSIDFQSISCSKHTKHIARFNGKKCLKMYKEVEIGFELSNERFINHITICFDESLQNTFYSMHYLTSKIAGYQIDYPRIEFIDGGFFNLGSQKISDLYLRDTQRLSINSLLGLEANSKKYIHGTNDYYLARGHLTAKTDFIYGSQQRLTFYYVNAAPQWQTHNAGNWLSLEKSVRQFSTNRSLDLVVYTGSFDIAVLPHEETGENTELYLYVDEKNKAIPVPKIFWKVVYEPKTMAGIAFVSVNNPYDPNPMAICKNICNKINWVNWKANDIKSGFSYCCTVASFRKIVKTFPTFKVATLLT